MACLFHASAESPSPLTFAEPGVRPHYAPDRSVRVEHLAVALSFGGAPGHLDGTFTGEATIRFKPYPGWSGVAVFDLDEVEVTSVTASSGEALPFEHGDGALRVRPGDHALVVIRWTGRHPRRGLYFIAPTPAEPDREHSVWSQCQDEDAHFFVPCHDHPSVKHPWTVTLSAPEGFRLLSNGRLVEESVRDGRATATYDQLEPMPAYLLTVVAAPLEVVAESWNGKAVRYLVPPGRSADVPRAFGRTVAMLDFLSERTGVEFPWPRYDQVVVRDFVFGGMENVACTTMTDLLLVDAKADLEFEPDALVVHELAHQWFGDLVTCQDWSQGWLNESWATYCEALWIAHTSAEDEATWYRWQTAQGYHGEAGGRYRRPIVSYDFREPIDVFDRHLYNKGSCVLWMLRHELGDEAFFGGVREYLRRHRNQTAHTRHFQRALEEASGRNLDGFFAQWVHSPGHPILDVKLGRDGEHGVTVTVKQTQSGEGVPAVFTIPLALEVRGASGRSRKVVLQLDERDRTYVIPGDEPVAAVRVDGGYHLLAELTLSGPDAWLVALLSDPCPVLALRAGKGLVAGGSVRGRRAVEEAVARHPYGGVRGALARELANTLPQIEAAKLLSGALAREGEPRARKAMVAALGRLKSDEARGLAADTALAVLEAGPATWQLEGAALLALGQTRDPRGLDRIRAALATASWADWVRCRALEALAETERADVLPDLLSWSGPTRTDRVRGAAATALGRLAGAVESAKKPALERLIQLADEPGFRSQLSAIAALGKLGDADAVPVLTRIHRSAPDGRTRRQAYEARTAVLRAGDAAEAVKGLTRRIDELQEEGARLRDRVGRLER